MTEFTREDKKALYATKEAVIEIKTILTHPEVGLCKKVDDIKDSHRSLRTDHNRLKQRFFLLVGVLSGLGILGGGSYGIAKFFGG